MRQPSQAELRLSTSSGNGRVKLVQFAGILADVAGVPSLLPDVREPDK